MNIETNQREDAERLIEKDAEKDGRETGKETEKDNGTAARERGLGKELEKEDKGRKKRQIREKN